MHAPYTHMPRIPPIQPENKNNSLFFAARCTDSTNCFERIFYTLRKSLGHYDFGRQKCARLCAQQLSEICVCELKPGRAEHRTHRPQPCVLPPRIIGGWKITSILFSIKHAGKIETKQYGRNRQNTGTLYVVYEANRSNWEVNGTMES